MCVCVAENEWKAKGEVMKMTEKSVVLRRSRVSL